jgi:predicted permease
MGGALGVLLANWGTIAFKALAPAGIPRMSNVQIDGRVLAFALTLSIATTLLVGLGPALLAVRADLASSLREGGRRSVPASAGSARLLVVLELSLALVLLSAAGLLTRSFAVRAAWNPGFEHDHLMTFSVFAPEDRFTGPDAVAALLDRIERQLSGVPGVERVGSASGGPLFGGDGTDELRYAVSMGVARSPAAWYDISPSYFTTLGVPIVAGRGLFADDSHGMPTVGIVNETLAKKFWPGDSPLDKEVSVFSDRMKVRVVGVVRDVPPSTPGAPAQPEIYWSNRQVPRPFSFFVLRTSVDPASVMPAVRARLKSIDPSLRPMNVSTMSDLVAANLRAPRFQMLLLAAFSVAALVLAAVGIYGLFAFRVSLRTREIGIRIALGAQKRQVMGAVLEDGLLLAGAGVVIGIGVSILMGRVMSRIAVGVPRFDPVGLATSCFVLLGVTIVACLAPARRAANVDPAVTLTVE